MRGRDWNEEYFQLRIPVSGAIKNEITTTVDGVTRSLAEGASPEAISIVADSEICLTWSFQLDPRLFIAIAKQMAGTLTAESPFDSPVSEWPSVDDQLHVVSGVKRFGIRGLQVPFSAVMFPSACCRCGVDTTSIYEVSVASRFLWWMPSGGASIEMPVCDSCWQASWVRFLAAMLLIEVGWTLAICGLIFKELPVFDNAETTATFYAIVLVVGILPTRAILSLQCLVWRVASVVRNITTNQFRFWFADIQYRDRMLQEIMRRQQQQ